MTQTINVGDTVVVDHDAPKGMVAKWFYNHFGCSVRVAEWLSTLVIAVIASGLTMAATALGIQIPVVA